MRSPESWITYINQAVSSPAGINLASIISEIQLDARLDAYTQASDTIENWLVANHVNPEAADALSRRMTELDPHRSTGLIELTPLPDAKTWRYKTVCSQYTSAINLEQELNRLGSDGWEVFSIVRDACYVTLYCRKPA